MSLRYYDDHSLSRLLAFYSIGLSFAFHNNNDKRMKSSDVECAPSRNINDDFIEFAQRTWTRKHLLHDERIFPFPISLRE